MKRRTIGALATVLAMLGGFAGTATAADANTTLLDARFFELRLNDKNDGLKTEGIDAKNLSSIIASLEKQGSLTIISAPRMTARQDEESILKVGESKGKGKDETFNGAMIAVAPHAKSADGKNDIDVRWQIDDPKSRCKIHGAVKLQTPDGTSNVFVFDECKEKDLMVVAVMTAKDAVAEWEMTK